MMIWGQILFKRRGITRTCLAREWIGIRVRTRCKFLLVPWRELELNDSRKVLTGLFKKLGMIWTLVQRHLSWIPSSWMWFKWTCQAKRQKKRGNLEAGVAALCCRCRIPLSGIQALPHHPSVQDGRYRTVHAVQGRDFMRFYAILLDFLSCFKDFLDLFQF